MKVDYFVRETAGNLWRNISITFASILTVSVTLMMLGGGIIIQDGVANATERWEGGIEFVIFLNPDSSEEQVDSIGGDLGESPAIQSFEFFDQEAAYEEFKELFADSPEFIESVTPDVLPPSYRVVPVDKEANAVADLGSQFKSKAGVREIIFASETIAEVQQLADKINLIIFIVSSFLGVAAALLIVNTVRMAVLARRREIEVQKLVGATNWFIRVPFMLEGLIQGVVGGGVAVVGLFLFEKFVLADLFSDNIPLVSGFNVTSGELFSVYIVVLVGGALMGALAAGIAVTRFLDV
jgi:cell division transport system permease protein